MNSRDYCPTKKDSTHAVVQRISNVSNNSHKDFLKCEILVSKDSESVGRIFHAEGRLLPF